MQIDIAVLLGRQLATLFGEEMDLTALLSREFDIVCETGTSVSPDVEVGSTTLGEADVEVLVIADLLLVLHEVMVQGKVKLPVIGLLVMRRSSAAPSNQVSGSTK